ncbi:MAG TPA: hypothetical protein VJB98_03850 [Candidatus Paceibacterota bacterium]
MLDGLFVRKANYDRVDSILKRENFAFTSDDVTSFLKGNQKGLRYGNKVLLRNEAGIFQKRFLKIVIDGTYRTYNLFKRQVKITEALQEDKNFDSRTLAVVRSSVKPPVPYAIFETLDEGDGFGFMHDNLSFYEKFTEQEMEKLVETMYKFHEAGANVNQKTIKLARDIPPRLKTYVKEADKLLGTRVVHKKKDGSETKEQVGTLIAQYMGITDVKSRVSNAFQQNFVRIRAMESSNYFLVHADMQIDNVYRHNNGDFELIDFEWVGRTKNHAVAIMYDYGNLRARAWSSKRFQLMLDGTMINVGARYKYSPDLVKAGLTLGKLRSSLMMARFHLDFTNTVKEDKRTEGQYYDMYPRTIATLAEVLK